MELDKELREILDDCLDAAGLKRKIGKLGVDHFNERFGDQADANRTAAATQLMVKLFLEARESLIRDKVEKKLAAMIKELGAARKKAAEKKLEDEARREEIAEMKRAADEAVAADEKRMRDEAWAEATPAKKKVATKKKAKRKK